MTKQATLHKVRSVENGAVFRVDAPAVAAALTRTGGTAEASVARIVTAFPGCSTKIERGGDDKWYVLVTRPAAPSKPVAESKPRKRVWDTDGRVTGNHRCGRCCGTGRYVVGTENGRPKFGHGECYRCAGKGYHTQADRKRNYGADINYGGRA